MSFVTMEDVMAIMEGLVKSLWTTMLGSKNTLESSSFPLMTYTEAIGRYGSDKPDTRYNFEIEDLALESGQVTELLPIGHGPFLKGTFILEDFDNDDWVSLKKEVDLTNVIPIGMPKLAKSLNLTPSSDNSSWSQYIGFIASRNLEDHVGSTTLGRIRTHLMRRLEAKGILERHKLKDNAFLWVYDFPLLARAEKVSDLTGNPFRQFQSMHHPFTAPVAGDLHLIETEPLKVRGQHYDLVLNGCEIGGGSIRIHSADLQEYILRQVIQLPDTYISHFQHLLNALRSGCPPHGGMAIGLDRIIAIMCGATSIRDVIAFPKNGAGMDLCVKSPN